MKIHGYTEEKDTVQVDLSVERIVEAGIDPWHLDLFEPHPIAIDFDEGTLFFSPLRDVAFAYVNLENDRMVAGICDEFGKQCFLRHRYGSQSGDEQNCISPSERSFSDHFLEYLRARRDKPANLDAETPLSASDVFVIPGGGLWIKDFATSLEKYAPFYRGEMFDQVAVSAQLPQVLNRLLVELAPWNPVFYREAIAAAILGKPCAWVYFLLAKGGLEEIRKRYQIDNLDTDSAVTFVSDGIKFMANAISQPYSPGKYDGECLGVQSVYCVSSTTPNTVSGCRIAFHDMGRSQSRLLLVPTGGAYAHDLESSAETLEGHGLKIIGRRGGPGPGNPPMKKWTTWFHPKT